MPLMSKIRYCQHKESLCEQDEKKLKFDGGKLFKNLLENIQ